MQSGKDVSLGLREEAYRFEAVVEAWHLGKADIRIPLERRSNFPGAEPDRRLYSGPTAITIATRSRSFASKQQT